MPPRKNSTPAPKPRLKPPTPRLMLIYIALGLLAGIIAGVIVYYVNPGRQLPLGTLNPTTTTTPAALSDEALYATYAGSSTCRECHAKAYDLWSTSHHGLAERDPDPALDRAAFDPPRTFAHGTQRTEVRTQGTQYQVVTAAGPTPEPAAFAVTRVIGVDPLRQYLVPATGDRLQTLEASYDPAKNAWFNVYGEEDRKPGEWGHWTGRGMNWNSQCAACHNTRVRKNYDEKSDAFQTAMAQRTVSCESCHGPMKQHVTSQKTTPTSPSPAGTTQRVMPNGVPPVGEGRDYKKPSKDQWLSTCASCHARRSELTGDFAPGDDFHDHYALTIPDLTDTFHPDGQVRDEDYEFTAFLGSKMHAAGVRCADCHEPHTSKPLFAGNTLCMRCHNGSFKGSPSIVPEQHSFHKADSAGNQCVNCHMPQTTYMQRHARHDHGFTIPDPQLTKEFGVPNACNRCHTDKDANWSLAAVDQRYGPKMNRPTRDRARAIATARKPDAPDAARAPILRLLAEEKQPFWQAVAAGVLARWAAAPDVTPALIRALDHADPLVREKAAVAIMPVVRQNHPEARQAMERRLTDPVRAVRIAAASALREIVNPQSPPGRELLASLHLNADQPTGAAELGLYHAGRNDLPAAVAYLQRAIAWDPASAPFHDSLANVLILQGQTAAAAQQYQLASQAAPREWMYAYKMGLTYDKLGQGEDALAALTKAEAANPREAQIPFARATILARQNRTPAARDAARRALQLDPNYVDAAKLLQQLGQ